MAPSTGFPSVRSKMLNSDHIRGDTFYSANNQMFSYSQYVVNNAEGNASQNVSVHGAPKTVADGVTPRSYSIDATLEKRKYT